MTLVLLNGKIYTLNECNDIAEAMLIDGGKIKNVGTSEEIKRLIGASNHVQLLDLKGCTLFPGFIDSHTHLGQLALRSLWVDLTNTGTKNEVLTLLKDRATKTPEGNWVVGVGYDDDGWMENDNITKTELDELSIEHPIFLRRVCGHYGVVNTRALEQISDHWKYVDRATGILIEDAVLGFMKIIKPDLGLRLEGTKKMLPTIHSLGITAVREIVNHQSIMAYHRLDKNNELKLRIFGYVIIDDLDKYLNEFPNGLTDNNNFKVIGVKILLDGSLGAHTAALNEPYTDDPENRGKLLVSTPELRSIFEKVKALDLSLMVHAIGDRSVQQFLDVYGEVFGEQIPENPKGHSLEHVELIDDGLVTSLKDLGIWVSAQPNFAGRWSVPGGLNERRLGKARLARCNPYRTFIENNVRLVFGSDSMPLDPLFGIRSAIFHPVKEQRISPMDAITAYVRSCYGLLNIDPKFGSIAPGKAADLVILSQDPFCADERDFDDIKVVGLIFNGDVLFSNGLQVSTTK